MRRLIYLCLAIAWPAAVFGQQSSIINSPHNLSASGPGAIRATSEQEVCIFCHTPHNAAPIQPLWNRNMPVNSYTVYSSSSLQATPGQPTGSSKLCLSCHDGTIAVGSVLSRGQPISMAGSITTLPPGKSNLGTDLSDDHPISFQYTAALTADDPKIKPPSAHPPAVKLDANAEMQCTSCHEAHNNTFGKFLVMDNTNSQLCMSCHQINDTPIAAHASCAGCHTMHSAPSGAMLLKQVNASASCLDCHSSTPNPNQGQNIAQDLAKISRHDNPPGAVSLSGTTATVTCKDCHEPHTMQSGTATAPLISPMLGKMSGVTIAGGAIATAQYGYEVCFKCHGDSAVIDPTINRQIVQTNTRLEFAPSAVSYHPVAAVGKSIDVPSLRTGMTAGSFIACSDCHASDTGKLAGSTGPNGPHGSNSGPLLVARYETLDNTPENASSYALCYKCHDRTSILNDESFSVHKLHVVDQSTPCSVCHDSHGISSVQGTAANNAHLINFDTTIVLPDPTTGRIEYRSTGARTGQCTLSCHGTAHSAQQYPAAAPLVPEAPPAALRALRAR